MNRNIELKATAVDFAKQLEIAKKLSDSPQKTLLQEDTFFNVESGRLKLRKFDPTSGELIYYQRSDTKHAKESCYKIYPTESPDTLKDILALSLDVIGSVKKTRYLFISGQTRIHLDDVDNLGRFIEFEYVLKPEEPPQNGETALKFLAGKLGIRQKDLISRAYIDLLLSDQ